MRWHSKQKGFTLIELLVVIAIIGTLASVVLASLNTARAKARDSKRAAEIQQLSKALQLYWLDNDGTYPPHTGTNGTYVDPGLSELTSGNHMSSLPCDPVAGCSSGSGYRYRSGGTLNGYTLMVRFETDTNTNWCKVVGGAGDVSGAWSGNANYVLTKDPLCF